VACVAFVACGDPYLHNNPYDPADAVTITVTGPDTIFSYAEVGAFGAQEVPAFPDTALRFAVSDSIAFGPTGALPGEGAFTSLAPPLYPATRNVTVMAMIGQVDTTISEGIGAGIVTVHTYAWRHVGSKTVVLTQRVTRIQLRCPDTHACDTLAVGGAASVWADGFDAAGHEVIALTSATANPASSPDMPVLVTFAVRDTTVAAAAPAGVRMATVTARKSGTTWIVATHNSLSDSLQIVVR
jgi:hypothetical protein